MRDTWETSDYYAERYTIRETVEGGLESAAAMSTRCIVLL